MSDITAARGIDVAKRLWWDETAKPYDERDENHRRRWHAARALEQYIDRGASSYDEPLDTVIQDLISDLLHLVDGDPSAVAETAVRRYLEEV